MKKVVFKVLKLDGSVKPVPTKEVGELVVPALVIVTDYTLLPCLNVILINSLVLRY